MTKIQTFGTKTRLKNNESLTFGREIETAIEAKGDDTLEITDIFPDYKAKLQQTFSERTEKMLLKAGYDDADCSKTNIKFNQKIKKVLIYVNFYLTNSKKMLN